MLFKLLAPMRDRWLWIFTAAALIWTLLPNLVGWMLAPDGYQMVGTTAMNPTDAVVYQSYIQQGQDGGWMMADRFTSEKGMPDVWQPYWWLVGRLTSAVGMSLSAAYLSARIISAILLVWALWWSAGWFFSSPAMRRLGIAIGLFGGGIGWLWAILTRPAMIITSSPDLWVAEMYPGLSLLASPHLPLITAGIVVMATAATRFASGDRWRMAWLATAAGLLVFSLHPFHLLTWALVGLAIVIWHLVVRQTMRRWLLAWSLIGAVSAPTAIWYWQQLRADDFFLQRAEQNIATTWFWPATILAFGIFGMVAPWSRQTDWRLLHQWRILCVWAAIGTLVLFLPFDFQRRLSQALFIPVAWLSLPVLWRWIASAATNRAAIFRIVSVVVVGAFSSWLALGLIIQEFTREVRVENRYNLYLSPGQQTLLSRLKEDPNPNHAVLASITTSQFIPAYGQHNVFIGHSVETLNYGDKQRQLLKFFSSKNRQRQADFLNDHQICWIVYGQRERAYGTGFQPHTWGTLTLAWSQGNTDLYQRLDCQ